MPNSTRISLRAARINANMTQGEAAKELSKYFGMKISRQRVMKYEENPQQTPPGFGQGFSTIYSIPIEVINFGRKST